MGTPLDASLACSTRGSRPEVSRIGDILRAETVGGVLLVAAAVLALVVGELAVARRVHAR